MPLLLLSQHLGFSSSHRSFLSDPTIHPYCATRQHTTQCSYTHLTDHIVITPVGCLFFILAGLLRHSVHIQKTPRVPYFSTRTSHQVLSFPLTPTIFILPNTNTAVLRGRSSPPLGCLPEVFVAWPHRSCLRSPRRAPCCVTDGGSRTCTILFVHLRLLSRYLMPTFPVEILALTFFHFYHRTTYLSLHCLSR